MSVGLVLGGVGAILGAPFGLAQVGFFIGSTLGGIIDRPDGPGAGDLSAPSIQEGHQLVRPYGTVMLTVNPVSVSEYTATEVDAGGKGGGGGSGQYTYSLDMLGAIAHRVPSMPLVAIIRVWVNKKLVESLDIDTPITTLLAQALARPYTSITLYPGGSAQVPPPEYEARVGTANASAYRNVATVEIIGLKCGGSKTPPLVEVEVITNGTQDENPALTLLQAQNAADSDESYYANGAPTTPTIFGATYQHVNADIAGVSGEPRTFEALVDVQTVGGSGANFAVVGYTPSDATGNADVRRIRILDPGTGTGHWSFDDANFSDTPLVPVEEGIAHLVIQYGAGGFGVAINGVWYITAAGGTFASAASGRVELEASTSMGAWVLSVAEYRLRAEQVYTVGVNFSPPNDIPDPDFPTETWTPGLEDLQDIVDAELALNPAINSADHDTSDLAGIQVRGFRASGPCGKTIAELGDIFYFDCVPANPIRYQLRGSASVATITNAYTGAGVDEAGEPFTGLKIGNDIERPAVVGLSAPNAAADHEPVFRRGDRLTTEGPDVRKVRTEVELTPAEVQGRSLAMTLMERASSQTAEFGLSDKYAAAEPGDAYSVYDDQGNLYSLLIRSLTYADGVKQVKWELNDTSALVETGITDGNYTPSLIVVAPVDSNLVPIDGPILQDADDDAGFYTAIEGEGTEDYPGGIVRRSVDDLDFTEVVTEHPTESVIGVASGALANWTGGYVWDEVSSVTVVVGEGQTLSSSTHAAMQANRNINSAFIGNDERWEVIRFRTATLGASRTYTLTGLLRGMRGTESFIGTHQAGDVFVLATLAGLRRAPDEPSSLGLTRYLKAVTNGRPAASATSEEFVNNLVGKKPFSPTNLRAERDGSANITFSIDRRPRLFPRYGGSGGSYIPPADPGETYELDVYATSGYATVLRTLTSSTESFSYTAAQQTTDFGSTQATVYTRSYSRSTIVGRGHYLQASA